MPKVNRGPPGKKRRSIVRFANFEEKTNVFSSHLAIEERKEEKTRLVSAAPTKEGGEEKMPSKKGFAYHRDEKKKKRGRNFYQWGEGEGGRSRTSSRILIESEGKRRGGIGRRSRGKMTLLIRKTEKNCL